MKLHSLIACLVLGAPLIASAQTAADPQQPAPKSVSGTIKLPPDTAGRGAVVDFSAQAGLLEVVVEQMTAAYSKAVQNNGSAGMPVPTLVYGPGAREARLGAPLHFANLTDVRIVDSLALVAAAAGCNLDPIYSLPQEGDVDRQTRIIGYRFSLPSDRALSPSPTTGGDVGGGESGAGDQLTDIGVALGQKDGYIVVAQVIPGSPADHYHAFNLGDRILQVAEMGQPWVDVTGLPLEKVTKMIRGKPGTSVRLAIDPITGHSLPEFLGGGGIYFMSLEREKLNPDPPKALIPKVAAVDVPDRDALLSLRGTLTPEGGKAGDAVTHPIPATTPDEAINVGGYRVMQNTKHPLPAATPDETNMPIVRIYAIGSILSGNDQDMKEDEFTKLVIQALDLAGLAKSGAPQLYFHTKSRVLIAKTTARGQEIVEQVVNALRESSVGGLQPIPPPKP